MIVAYDEAPCFIVCLPSRVCPEIKSELLSMLDELLLLEKLIEF